MNRGELLTKLAMELAEWPDFKIGDTPPPNAPGAWSTYHSGWQCIALHDNGSKVIDEGDYLAERERLINKPSWDAAPADARWLAQGPKTSDWYWVFGSQPVVMIDTVGDLEAWAIDPMSSQFAVHGHIPAGHDWRTTLEKRPVDWPDERRIDVIGANGNDGSHYEDDAFKECERRLNDQHLSADPHCPSPGELVRRMLIERCDELKSANDLLVDENQRLRRALNELTQEAV